MMLKLCADDTPTLASICGVSRVFHGLATPLLYARFRQERADAGRRSLVNFLRSIITRLDLARHVKQVALQRFDDDFLVPDVDEDTKRVFERRIDNICEILPDEQFSSGSRKVWKERIQIGAAEAYPPILICSVPNIETIIFQNSYGPECLLSALEGAVNILRSPQQSRQDGTNIPFSKLRLVRTVSDETKYDYIAFQDLYAFFKLPNIRDFEIVLANGEGESNSAEEFDQELWPVNPRSSSIQRLSFQSSALTGPCMRSIVKSCTKLIEFHFTYGRIHMYDYDFTPSQLQKTLLQHTSTSLEVLHVNYDDDW